MPSITVQLTKPALKDLDGLADPVRSSVLSCISRLQDDPLPDGQSIKKLKGFAFPLFRLRSGDHRILYRIDQNVVTVMRVVDRKDLEKTTKRLKLRG
jgi:mRNA-degrading endonuclease RelE of RelBE toxin-antitoxin system